jgi:hypothetical protein
MSFHSTHYQQQLVHLPCCEFFVQFIHSQLFCSTLQKTTNMACQILQNLDLYILEEI